jgi:hypothetical protein
MGQPRKPLFMNQDEGFHEEMALTDEMTLGKLSIDAAGGTGIDMNSHKITELSPATTSGDALAYGQNNALLGTTEFSGDVDMGHNQINNLATPTEPDDAVTKAYVDALAQGLDPHAGVYAKVVSGLGTHALKAGATGGGVALPMAGESFDLKIHDPYGTTVPVVFTTEATLAAVAATINAAVQGVFPGTYLYAQVNGANIDLRDAWTGKKSRINVSNVVETTPGDLVGKTGISTGTATGTGFTAAGAGVGKTLEAPTDSAAYNTIDGHLFTATGVAQRVLVASEGGDEVTPDVDNGLYTVTTLGDGAGAKFKLTRATDCDQQTATEFHTGVYVFVVDGTTFKDTGWSCITADPINPDTTPNAWAQFSGSPSYTYDQGLIKLVTSIQVHLDDAADAQGAGAPTASRISGLEFDANSAGGKLRVAVAPNGGIQRYQTSPYGLEVKLQGTTLQLDGTGAGLSVKGVPAQFEIAGNGVSANVTHTNLNTLTAGSGSNADSLHTHSSLIATSAPKVELPLNGTGGSIAAFDPVYVTSTNNRIDKANTTPDANSRVIGIARSVATITAIPVVVTGVIIGAVTGVTGAGAGVPVYLKNGGGLTTDVTTGYGAKRIIQVGICTSADDLFVRIVDYGKKAA